MKINKMFQENGSLSVKYNSRAAALYRDKISTEAQGGSWSEKTSSGRYFISL